MTLTGWFQIAFLSDLSFDATPIIPVQVGDRRLMAILKRSQVEIYDGICPHRGASLAHGGRLDGDTVICPFHGYPISLLAESKSALSVRRHPSLTIGDMVFVHLGGDEPLDLGGRLSALATGHRIVPGFTLPTKVPHHLVTENAFDSAHFAPVHQARVAPVRTRQSADRIFIGETLLTIPPSRWQRSAEADGMVRVPLTISAFGAGLVISDVGGVNPYTVITSATPQTDGMTTIRLSLAFPKNENQNAAETDHYMIQQSRRGLELDCAIWDQLDPTSVPHFVEADAAVIAFRDYIQRFLGGATE